MPVLRFNIKTVFPGWGGGGGWGFRWCWDSHYKDKVIGRPWYIYNGNSYTGSTFLFWNAIQFKIFRLFLTIKSGIYRLRLVLDRTCMTGTNEGDSSKIGKYYLYPMSVFNLLVDIKRLPGLFLLLQDRHDSVHDGSYRWRHLVGMAI